MRRAAFKLLKLISPGTAHMLSEWHLTLIGHRYELLKQKLENAVLSTRSTGLSLEWTISSIRAGATGDRRLAFISVLPPAATGIATCSLRSWLGGREKVDIFCPVIDDDWFFSLADRLSQESDGACRLFDVRALLLGLHHNRYSSIVIAVGNSYHHHYIFEVLGKIQAAGMSHGVVMYVHDPCLLHLIHDAVGLAPAGFVEMLEIIYGRGLPATAITADKWKMSQTLVEEGVFGLRVLFEKFGVRRFLVNSSTAAEMCTSDLGDLPARVEQIFHPVALPGGWRPSAVARTDSGHARPLVVGTFGMPGPDKRTELVIAAVRELTRRAVPVRLVLAGYECAHWALRHADELRGLDVEARDMPSDCQFIAAMSSVDVAVQLRMRNLGESSGPVHELLALGRNVIVSDIGSFREFGKAVRTIPVDASASALADVISHTWEYPIPQTAIADYAASHSSERFRQALVRLCHDPESPKEKTVIKGTAIAEPLQLAV